MELNEEVVQCAKDIFMNEPKVTIISGDILEKLPENGTTFYLFNPFGEEVLKRFLEEVEKRITHPVRILYLHPICRAVFEEEGSKWRLVEDKKIKPRFLGQLELCVYAKEEKY